MLGVVESLAAARMIVVEDEEPAVVGEVDRLILGLIRGRKTGDKIPGRSDRSMRN